MTEAAGPIPAAAEPGGFTILRPVDARRQMTKAYNLTAAGYVARMVYPEAKTFRAEYGTVSKIEDLHCLLTRLEPDPGAFIVRGAPKASANLAGMLRRKLDRKDGAATMEDVPRSWVMIDADKVTLPVGYSVINDPEDVARYLLELFAGFAPELEDASAVVQFSSSAGIGEMAEAEAAAGLPARWDAIAKGGNTVSAHLWFWLTVPQGEKALRRWADACNQAIGHKAIDPATMDPIQAHYTAAPVFGQGLRDPLAGRRTVLVRGSVDAVTLDIPAEVPRQARQAGGATPHNTAAAGFNALLGRIGDPVAGFNQPITAAVASFIATNWPNPDIEALKEILRERIEAADPGGRSQSEIDRYASDAYLSDKIGWVMDRQAEKAEQDRAEREKADATDPTFPDRGVTLAEAQRQAAAAVEAFAERMREGERPETMLRMTVGGGKSEAAVQGAVTLLNAARAGAAPRQIEVVTGSAITLMKAASACGGWAPRIAALHLVVDLLRAGQRAADAGAFGEGALYVLIPRHDLGGELAARITKAHPDRKVATWRGMDAEDPERPGKRMCLDPELPKAAGLAGVDATAACGVCPLRNECGYRRQRGQQADIWIGAHNLGFQTKPKALPAAAAVVIDEAFWSAAVKGQDGSHPIRLALSALQEDRTGSIGGVSRLRLLDLRQRVARALEGHEAGLLMRSALEAEGLTSESGKEWHALEWETKPKIKFQEQEDWPRERILDALHDAGGNTGFSKLRATLAGYVRDLLAGDAARSINVTFEPSADLGRNQGTGPALRFNWREDFAEWCADAPKLFLDATTHPDVLRAWSPKLTVTDIEISTPHQHVRQAVNREFGRTFFTANSGNVKRLADLALAEMAQAGGDDVLVVTQVAAEDLLRAELERRAGTAGIALDAADPQTFIAPTGARLHLAHHGGLTGMNRWRSVGRIVVVGRPALNRHAGERLAEIIYGRPLDLVQDSDDNHWPTAPGGVRMADGRGHRVATHRHPDSLVEGLRWSITEGAVLQAIGRARGVQRTSPVHVTLLCNLPLPLTVEQVSDWAAFQPDNLTTAAAEAALAGVAIPFAPVDMVKARPDLWATEKAAEHDKKRSIGTGDPHPLIDPTRKELRGFAGLAPIRYRRSAGGGRWSYALVPANEKGRDLLEAHTGPLAVFEHLSPADAETARNTPAPAPKPRPAQEAPAPQAPAESDEPAAPPPAPPQNGARIYAVGDEPPFIIPGAAAAPPPPSGHILRPVPPSPAPTARETLNDLAARLERLRPPRLWGDAMDELRMATWRERLAAAAAEATARRARQATNAAGAA